MGRAVRQQSHTKTTGVLDLTRALKLPEALRLTRARKSTAASFLKLRFRLAPPCNLATPFKSLKLLPCS
jgi:hypothetical protein